ARCVNHIPAYRPLPQMSPIANSVCSPASKAVSTSPVTCWVAKLSLAISKSPRCSRRAPLSFRCTWAPSESAFCRASRCRRTLASSSSSTRLRASSVSPSGNSCGWPASFTRGTHAAWERRSSRFDLRTSASLLTAASRSPHASCLRLGRSPAKTCGSAHEFVAHPVHRQKETRLFRLGLEFLAQAHDVRVHRPRGGVALITPHVLQQAVARYGLARVGEKILKE